MNEYLGKIITFLFGSSLRRIYLVIVFRSLIKLQWFCLIFLRCKFWYCLLVGIWLSYMLSYMLPVKSVLKELMQACITFASWKLYDLISLINPITWFLLIRVRKFCCLRPGKKSIYLGHKYARHNHLHRPIVGEVYLET